MICIFSYIYKINDIKAMVLIESMLLNYGVGEDS